MLQRRERASNNSSSDAKGSYNAHKRHTENRKGTGFMHCALFSCTDTNFEERQQCKPHDATGSK